MKLKSSLGETPSWLPQQPVCADVRTKDSSAAAEAMALSVVLTSFQHLHCRVGFNARNPDDIRVCTSFSLVLSISCYF